MKTRDQVRFDITVTVGEPDVPNQRQDVRAHYVTIQRGSDVSSVRENLHIIVDSLLNEVPRENGGQT